MGQAFGPPSNHTALRDVSRPGAVGGLCQPERIRRAREQRLFACALVVGRSKYDFNEVSIKKQVVFLLYYLV